MLSGVRPIIRLASWPTARTSPVLEFIATTRRLVEEDALAADVDQRVGGAEVDGHVAADETVCHCAASVPACRNTACRGRGRLPGRRPTLRVGSALPPSGEDTRAWRRGPRRAPRLRLAGRRTAVLDGRPVEEQQPWHQRAAGIAVRRGAGLADRPDAAPVDDQRPPHRARSPAGGRPGRTTPQAMPDETNHGTPARVKARPWSRGGHPGGALHRRPRRAGSPLDEGGDTGAQQRRLVVPAGATGTVGR